MTLLLVAISDNVGSAEYNFIGLLQCQLEIDYSYTHMIKERIESCCPQ